MKLSLNLQIFLSIWREDNTKLDPIWHISALYFQIIRQKSYWFPICISTHHSRHHRLNTDWTLQSQGWGRTTIKPQSTAFQFASSGIKLKTIAHVWFTSKSTFYRTFSSTFLLFDENWKWTKTKKFFIVASLKNFRLDSLTLRCCLWRRKSWMKMWKCKLTTCYVFAGEKMREK